MKSKEKTDFSELFSNLHTHIHNTHTMINVYIHTHKTHIHNDKCVHTHIHTYEQISKQMNKCL